MEVDEEQINILDEVQSLSGDVLRIANISLQEGKRLGARETLNKVKEHYEKVSFLVYQLCVGSDRDYLMLRDLMMFEDPAEFGLRRSGKKIFDRSIPTFSSLNEVKKLEHADRYNINRGLPLYYEDGKFSLEGDHYIGSIIKLVDRAIQIGLSKCDPEIQRMVLDPQVIQILTWSDGAQVDRSTVYNRVRFFGSLFESGKSPMYWWFAYNGSESLIKDASELRIEELESLCKSVWQKDGIYYSFQFNYLSDDHKMSWTEFGQWMPWKCTRCILKGDTEGWLHFCQPNLRNLGTNLLFYEQEKAYGVKKCPPLMNQGWNPVVNNAYAVAPLLHDVKQVINHTLLVLKHYSRIQINGVFIGNSLKKANELIDDRIKDKVNGAALTYNRHQRKIISHFGDIFKDVLPIEPLTVVGECAAIVSFLAYQKNKPENRSLYWAQLQIYVWLWINLLVYYWSPAHCQKKKKIKKCNSIYEHNILFHLAEQFWNTDIVPIDLAEEDGEGGVKISKDARSNHKEETSIPAQLVHEQVVPLGQQWLPVSRQNEYRKTVSTQSKMPHPRIKNVIIYPCIYSLNGSNINHLYSLVAERTNLASFDEGSITFMIGDGLDSEQTQICVCGEHKPIDSQWVEQFFDEND